LVGFFIYSSGLEKMATNEGNEIFILSF